jgi:hypothetical protein
VAVAVTVEDTVETAVDMVVAAVAAAVDLTVTAAEVAEAMEVAAAMVAAAAEAAVATEAEDMAEDTPLTRLLNRISLLLTEVLLRILPPLGLPNRTTLRHTTPTNCGVCGLILDRC